jgi:selenocysteine lyase/cysteine desulfurase
MLAPVGTGLLYVRPERQQEVWPTLASSAWDDQSDLMYRLMQYGTGNLSLLLGLAVAVDFHNQIGSARIQQRDFALADRLRTGLAKVPGATIVSPTHPELTCATTVYGLQGKTGGQIQDFLWDRGRVRVRSMGDTIGVRHACHIYNSPAEVDKALALLKEMAT